MTTQITIVADADQADAFRGAANDRHAHTLADGLQLVSGGRAWDLPVPDWQEPTLGALAYEYGCLVYRRPADVATMRDALADAGVSVVEPDDPLA